MNVYLFAPSCGPKLKHAHAIVIASSKTEATATLRTFVESAQETTLGSMSRNAELMSRVSRSGWFLVTSSDEDVPRVAYLTFGD